MGLGSVAKKAGGAVSKAKDVAKKASPEQLKQSALENVKKDVQDRGGLLDKLGGVVEGMWKADAARNQKAMDIIRSIGR